MATHSQARLSRARALYGALPDQLRNPDSFANQLRHLLEVRRRFRIYKSRQVAVPDVRARGLLNLMHDLPDGLGLEVTALNFSTLPLEKVITLAGAANLPVRELLRGEDAGFVDDHGRFLVQLQGHEGKAYLSAPR